MTYQNKNEFSKIRNWRIRKPSNLPSPVLQGMAEIKMIGSYLKLLIHVEEEAFGIYNRARIDKNITKEEDLVELGAASAYIACKKNKIKFSGEQFSVASKIKFSKIKELAEKI